MGDTWHLDELFVMLNGRRQYLWRAVDEDGDVIDILVQPDTTGVAHSSGLHRPLGQPPVDMTMSARPFRKCGELWTLPGGHR